MKLKPKNLGINSGFMFGHIGDEIFLKTGKEKVH
jgi:hypothetical protein